MKKAILSSALLLLFCFVISCSKSESEEPYIPIDTSVKVDISVEPFQKLSEYRFFEGDMKLQKPNANVIPYEPASSLFTDYAKKKRFVWMPKNTKATYNGDTKTLELPIGSAIIKTFYYDNVLPSNTTRIMETRVMIRKASGWIFAEYIWNETQTEATFDLLGSSSPVKWLHNNVEKNINYRFPAEAQCVICHKTQQTIGANTVSTNIPIGIKPQNLNFNFTYSDGVKNQLAKWIELGMLENNFTFPSAINTTVDYKDLTKSLEERARSYVDINCAHCHQSERHCNYRAMRFAYNETQTNRFNMGVCMPTADMQNFEPALGNIVTPGNINRSMLFHRINTEDERFRMPLHGRTIIHTEGVALMEEWINSLKSCN